MPLNAQWIAQQMAKHSPVLGDQTGTLKVVHPGSVTRKGHNLNVRKSGTKKTHLFERVRGSWVTQSEQNQDGMGNVDTRAGQAVFYHWQFDRTHAELREFLQTPGAELYWDQETILVDELFHDQMQDATVIRFRLSEVA